MYNNNNDKHLIVISNDIYFYIENAINIFKTSKSMSNKILFETFDTWHHEDMKCFISNNLSVKKEIMMEFKSTFTFNISSEQHIKNIFTEIPNQVTSKQESCIIIKENILKLGFIQKVRENILAYILNKGIVFTNFKSEILNIKLDMFNTDIFDIVHDIKNSPCYLCARMRRGYLYTEALKRGCNKIALGHHFDDVIETVLMSMLYGAEFKTMMPKLVSKNYDGIELIRPMYLVKEQSIISWAKYNELDFLQCACRFTEENYNQKESTSKRKEIKRTLIH